LVGNSHAWRLLPGLVAYAQRHRWRVVTALRTNCLGLVTRGVARGDGLTSRCLQWSVRVQRRLLARHDLDVVVFAGYRYDRHFLIPRHATTKQLQAGRAAVLETWRSFQAAGIQVIVTEDVPGMRPRSDPTCIAQSHRITDPCAVRRSSVVRTPLSAALAQANPLLASYLPLDQYFCDAKLCHALIGGVVVYYDSHHMTTKYSKTLGPYLGSAIADVLSKQPRPGGA
jgi:SGNH domain (fused to AT3 domains)